MFRLKNYLLFILLGLAQTSLSQQTNFKSFGLEQGLPQSQVFDVLQDSRGFLWVGTRGGGIARFDGQSFKVFNTRQGLVNNFVNCLYEDHKGDIWVGTRTGISRYNGRDFTNYHLKEEGDARVFCITQIDTLLLLGSSDGLYVFDGTSFKQILTDTETETFYVTSLSLKNEEVYVGTNRGLYILETHTWKQKKQLTRSDGMPDSYVQSLEADSAGIWVGTYGRGIVYYNGEKFINPQIPLPSTVIAYDIDLIDQELWIATQSFGAFQYDLKRKKLRHFGLRTGLTNNHVRSIEEDHWGNIWLGTSGGGLNLFAGQYFQHLTVKEGLGDNYVYSVFQTFSGELIAGTGKKGITIIDSNNVVVYGRDSGYANVKVKAICQTRDSTVWLGSEGGGLTYYKNDTFQWITTFDGLCGNYIKDIECTPNGRVWVATLDGGISEVIPVKRGFKIKNYRYLTELPSNRITALDAYGKNEVWFGTESKGIGVIKRGAVRMVLDEAALDYQSVRALRRRGNFVWLATSDGLMRYNVSNKELEKISADIKSSNLYLLEFDKQNRLYLGHERGLEKLTVNETGDVIEVEFYGSSEGFQGIETCQNASFCDRQGNMWFGTVNGLTSYNPNMVQSNVTKPKVWLEKVDLFYESLNSNTFEYVPYTWDSVVTPPRFPYHQNHLSFEFVGIDLNNPSRLSYQWKLEGFDKEWIKPTTKTDAIYSNLPPGDYVLKYRSISSDGQTSDIHRWSFLIHEPVWQTWWFRTLLWVVPILLVLIIVLSYVRRIKIKARRQTEKITLEKELIELEQKALRLQMNPHFLFNALNSIQSLVALENHKDARKYLQKFAKLMRLTLQNSRVDSIPLSDEIGTLQNYMELEQLTKKPAFRFSIDVEDQIQPDDLYIPPMMLQPFIENSIKHGLVDLGDKGQLTVRFRLDHDKLVCEIEDNGIGRVAAQEKAKEKSKTHESAAIQVISDRLDILNQEHAGNSLEIIDLESGTLVRVKLVVA